MSIVAVACPKQLSFPWMQIEVATKSTRKSTKRSRAVESTKPRTESVSPVAEQPVAERPATVVAIPASQPIVASPTAIKVSKVEVVTPVQTVVLDRNQRVGEVRIGKVMMQLLKRYGITDEEISSVLASIAQENYENLAS